MSIYNFISSDYELGEVKNDNIKFFKLKAGVEVGIDDKGKIYHHRNHQDINSPDLFEKCKEGEQPDVIFASQEDMDDLEIRRNPHPLDSQYYTRQEYIYTVEVKYSKERGQKLINYIKKHLKYGHSISIFSIWLDEEEAPEKRGVDVEQLSVKDIEWIFDGRTYTHAKSLVIHKK